MLQRGTAEPFVKAAAGKAGRYSSLATKPIWLRANSPQISTSPSATLASDMRLNSLSLTNFRNYARLEMRFLERVTLLRGANAQGKTNLLEAIHLLATGRSPRAGSERELIHWLALESPLPYARLQCQTGDAAEPQTLELVLELTGNGGNGQRIQKRVRVNGAPKRALDLVGRMRVVLFLPEDVSLVAGAPGERRRYLDIALCQISSSYCHALSEYNRSLSQRNALLKQLREAGGDRGQLTFWNARLAEFGSLVSHRRTSAVRDLDRIAGQKHRELSGGKENLLLTYLPSPDLNAPWSANGRRLDRLAQSLAQAPSLSECLGREDWRQRFLENLQHGEVRDIAAGTSLIGPHRDDVGFFADDRDLRTYGSRGQQRTAALALKLAELQMMREETDDSPLLLLDDVMSELDGSRRKMVTEALESVSQAVITSTDFADFPSGVLDQAGRYEVVSGCISQAAG